MSAYDSWAPKELIAQIERSKSFHEKWNSRAPETIIDNLLSEERFRDLSDTAIENLRQSLYRNQLALPADESLELQHKMVSDPRMRDVWNTLKRREKTPQDSIKLWRACEDILLSWRGQPKFTSKERQEFYKSIFDHAAALQSLIGRAPEFHFFSLTKLIDPATVDWLIEVLEIETSESLDETREYVRFCLDDVVPSLNAVLNDIGSKARDLEKIEPIVRKPGSANAPVHYFVRLLSRYLKSYYGQPLHEVVATITAVIFSRDDIDAGLVRKLVK